ncbi:MAG: Hsp20/alpha crystallin family protein [Candidatus Caldarchaeum sp.]
MSAGVDWDEFFKRVREDVESRLREAFDQLAAGFEPFVRGEGVYYTYVGDRLYAVFEVAGCPRDKIELTAEENRITVFAELVSPPSPEFGRLHPFARGKSIHRVLRLPRAIDPSKVEAKYDSGLLFIMAEIAKPRGVKVSVE